MKQSLKRPKVTIGLPVFNGENYLGASLESVLAQSFEDFELIISDNASTDATPEICRAFSEKDPRIRYHRNQKNVGIITNFNHVVSLARGEYFQWMAHDDVLLPEYLSECVQILDNHPSVFLAYSKSSVVDENGEPVIDPTPLRLHLLSLKPHERWNRYFQAIYPKGGYLNLLYGLMRTELLASTLLFMNYPNSDSIFLSEMVLMGDIYESQKTLFIRRIHQRAVTEGNPDLRKRARVMDPKSDVPILFPHWRWLYEYLVVLKHAPISPLEKLKCYPALFKYYFRFRYKHIVLEMIVFGRMKTRRAIRTLISWKATPAKEIL